MIPHQELNEALTKWRWPNPNYDIHMDSTEIRVFESPIYNVPLAQCRLFTLSLDAIDEWLAPQVDGYALENKPEEDNRWEARVRVVNRYFHADGETPALTLSQAFRKAAVKP